MSFLATTRPQVPWGEGLTRTRSCLLVAFCVVRHKIVVSSSLFAIPATAALASQLRAQGVDMELWVFSERERQKAAAFGAFSSVRNLVEGFDRRGSSPDDLSAARLLEQRLNINLHWAAVTDRTLAADNFWLVPPMNLKSRWTWPELCALALHIALAAEAAITESRPALFLAEVVDFPSCLLFGLARHMSVPAYNVSGMTHYEGARFVVASEVVNVYSGIAHNYEALLQGGLSGPLREIATRELHRLRADERQDQLTRRSKTSDFFPSPIQRFGPSRVLNPIREWLWVRSADGVNSPHAPLRELLNPLRRIQRKLRLASVRRNFNKVALKHVPQGHYFTFFLHCEPEITLEYWSFDRQDQVAVIRSIAGRLPADHVLVVREHPGQSLLRDPTFYGELSAIPGVLLVSDQVPAGAVLNGACGVFTLTGTVAVEAMCKGIPVGVLADVTYASFPGVTRLAEWEDIDSFVNDVHDFRPPPDDQVLMALAARRSISVPGTWLSRDPEVISSTAQSLAKLVAELGDVGEIR